MAAAHRGDAGVYERLLRELGTVVERYVRQRFGPLPFLEDCVQECLLAIHTARHTYDPRRPFRPWFFTIVRNRTIDFLRRSYVAPLDTLPTHGLVPVPEIAPDPVAEISAGELLRQLAAPYRDALELTKVLGYSTSEAAARLGISEPALRARVSRALRATAELLRKEQLDS
jgi:RNA polymerase sigma-70 factor (ECF subfamily)